MTKSNDRKTVRQPTYFIPSPPTPDSRVALNANDDRKQRGKMHDEGEIQQVKKLRHDKEGKTTINSPSTSRRDVDRTSYTDVCVSNC